MERSEIGEITTETFEGGKVLKAELGTMVVIGTAAHLLVEQEGIELLSGLVDPRTLSTDTDK